MVLAVFFFASPDVRLYQTSFFFNLRMSSGGSSIATSRFRHEGPLYAFRSRVFTRAGRVDSHEGLGPFAFRMSCNRMNDSKLAFFTILYSFTCSSGFKYRIHAKASAISCDIYFSLQHYVLHMKRTSHCGLEGLGSIQGLFCDNP